MATYEKLPCKCKKLLKKIKFSLQCISMEKVLSVLEKDKLRTFSFFESEISREKVEA